MLINRIMPARCAAQSDALRRAAELHAISSLAVGNEARKFERRVPDLRVIVDAAERRAGLRAADDALRHMRRDEPSRKTEGPDA